MGVDHPVVKGVAQQVVAKERKVVAAAARAAHGAFVDRTGLRRALATAGVKCSKQEVRVARIVCGVWCCVWRDMALALVPRACSRVVWVARAMCRVCVCVLLYE